ncbi:putative pyridine nucleotide-disulfide oxidoreductase [Sodiomyces alkalinus F11]|uniref:Putative pyridine nucleotide-disulfide oxidoreductase n=1 Tax=Sodiomyces alkalinus (strain CBS 110278 / VKM F-3762 / F11) TaxID=1314773 RepID=A0A3N2PWS6_SODAK|nr:putative pyridine nucleotide-disulfide oxidoreductase [Sodiomyces alkalinus F11]ROT38785.1 putative pyridine nucleotide-disulfide oxidoreductase [Sodiomyces alkalinus F11]
MVPTKPKGHFPWPSVFVRSTCHHRKERVVVLGSGWAGYALARDLDPRKYDRIVISPRSYFVFTPLLASTSVGTLEFRAILESVRRLKPDAFYQGWADDIDFNSKTVRVEANPYADELSSRTLPVQVQPKPPSATDAVPHQKSEMIDVPYDKLILAVGAYSQTFNVPGVRDHAHFLRDVGDARAIRSRVLQCFERAAAMQHVDSSASPDPRSELLHFAVVGGGPTGIEFAAELHDLVHDDLARLYPHLMRHVSITVYDIAPKVLPMFDHHLAAYAVQTFHRQGIQVKTEHHLQEIRPDPEGKGGPLRLKIKEYGDREIPAGIVVWSTGLMQNPLVKKVAAEELRTPTEAVGERSERKGEAEGKVVDDAGTASSAPLHIETAKRSGSILTDDYLRVRVVDHQGNNPRVLPDVFAMGDCGTIAGQSLPATAQVAAQQAVYLAKALNKHAENPEIIYASHTKPFRFRNLGTMAYLGSWNAIHQSKYDGLKGRIAWVLWRMAYLTRSMSLRNKIMVPVYWAITWIFGRDISRF